MSQGRGTLLGATVLVACSGLAMAQQRPDAGSILEQQQLQDRLPSVPSSPRVLPKTEPARPALPASPAIRATVSEFRFIGNTVFASAELEAVVREFIGRTLSFDELNGVASRVQRYYRDRGYFLAVAYLPAQKISAGAVEIAVLEGRLGRADVQPSPGTRLRQSFAQGVLDAHLKPGEPVTEAQLERPLLILDDLPGVTATSSVAPSSSLEGAADLTVKIEEDPRLITGYVDFDNGGNRYTGEFRPGVNLNANNLTGYGDQLSLRGYLTDERMHYTSLSYSIPVLHHGTRIGGSYTLYDYRLAKDFTPLQAHGEGEVLSLYALHPLLRTRDSSLYVQLGADKKKFDDRIDAASLVDVKKVDSWRFAGVGDFRDGFLSGGLTTYSIAYTSGKLQIENPILAAADAAPGTGLQTAGSFTKTNIELRRLQRLGDRWDALLSLSYQDAGRNLSSSEKLSLGGPSGVRAYPVGEAPGDTGYLFSAEVRYLVPGITFLGGSLTASGFYDHGAVRGNENPIPGTVANKRALAGIGAGLALAKDGDFLVKLTVATPTENETPTSDSAKRDPRLWFQAIKWF